MLAYCKNYKWNNLILYEEHVLLNIFALSASILDLRP